jgi:predicted transcriptional regulator
MNNKHFPIEKVFGSRTRVKIITLFTTGISRPYYVREIARTINERLNAVRRELDILQKIGMLDSYDSKRRKFYTVNQQFILLTELTSIMQKAGPEVDDGLFKNIERLGDIRYACASGLFTGTAEAPTDLLVIGNVDESKLELFVKRIEGRIGQEVSYTPITENEYQYRINFKYVFLKNIFSNPHKVIVNKLKDPHSFRTFY